MCQKMYSMQLKRARVAKELLETEEFYVGSLEKMIHLYMKPLIEACKTENPIISKVQIQTIFSVIEVMTNLNKVRYK